MDKASIHDPIYFLHLYLTSILRQQREFVVLRQSISRSSQITSSKPVICYCTEKNDLVVRSESGVEKSFPTSSFESVKWQTVSSSNNGNLKYILITTKNERNPIVIHGPTDAMEMWFDALKLVYLKHSVVETQASLNKVETITMAATFANIQLNTGTKIPPRPDNYEFVSSFPDEQ